MLTQKECILMKLLNCGSADLEMLEDIQYDLDDILDDLVESGNLNINALFEGVFIKGREELQYTYDSLINDLEVELEENPDDNVLIEQFKELKMLDIENDFTWYANCLDTHVYLENKETYDKYFEDELCSIEIGMGFEFE